MVACPYLCLCIIFVFSATLSPTPQSPSPTTQRQQDSGFVEQLGDVSSDPLVAANTQSIESSKTGHQEPDVVRAYIYKVYLLCASLIGSYYLSFIGRDKLPIANSCITLFPVILVMHNVNHVNCEVVLTISKVNVAFFFEVLFD